MKTKHETPECSQPNENKPSRLAAVIGRADGQQMEYIDDLSWSGLVDFIQHEDAVGADVLNNLALELEELKEHEVEAELVLSRIRARKNSVISGAHHVAKHLQKPIPLAVLRQGYIVVLSEKDFTIERNVI